MSIAIVEEPPARLAEYGRIPIGFRVSELIDERGLAALMQGLPVAATPLGASYWKDYDAHAGNGPTAWPDRFDLTRWTILAAYRHARRVGGAIVIVDDPQIELLGDCRACALLWDLRVAPDVRRRGVGSALLHAVEGHAARRGARALRVETQQVNVPACRFYRRHDFHLERATAGAYPELPDEIQLLWRKTLP